MKLHKIKIALCIIYLITPLILIKLNPIIFLATNDDGIFVSILESNFEFIGKNNLIYTSMIYGNFIKFFYVFSPYLQWHGIFLLLTALVSLLYFTYEILKLEIDRFLKLIIIFMIYIQYIYMIFAPNFSSAALNVGLIGTLLFYLSIFLNKNIKNIIFILLIISYLIRPDGFIFILYVILPGVFYLTFKNIKTKKIKRIIDLRWLVIIFLVGIDLFYRNFLTSKSYTWNEYYKFINLFHQVDTNPSMLKMHQKIASFQIPGLSWSNVEATLLHQIAYFDSAVFNSASLKLAVESVHEFLGLSGLVNADFYSTLIRIWQYMYSVNYLFYACLTVFVILIILFYKNKFIILIIFSWFYMFFIFYFLGAVWRIPLRILLPILFSFLLFLILISFIFVQTSKIKIIITMTSLALFTFFHLNQFGLKGTLEKSSIRIKEYKSLQESYQSLGSAVIFIGQIKYLDENYTNAYVRNNDLNTLHISSGWHTFSPYWLNNLNNLKIQKNPLFSVANQSNVYWVSDKYISEVIDMYMNDRKIKRQEKCKIKDLGINNGAIYSFSKKGEICLK